MKWEYMKRRFKMFKCFIIIVIIDTDKCNGLYGMKGR